MSSESFTSAKVNNEELDKDTPLSDDEISRLIQASRETQFKRTAIKEDMAEEFKKVSLHDIAKKYSKDIFSKEKLMKVVKMKRKTPKVKKLRTLRRVKLKKHNLKKKIY